VLLFHITDLDFKNPEELFPAIFTMIMIPFTFSIANGASLGYCFIVASMFGSGNWRAITPVMWALVGTFRLQNKTEERESLFHVV
jgi:AGZA family xanthine/uracil permease-like MFS transporter